MEGAPVIEDGSEPSSPTQVAPGADEAAAPAANLPPGLTSAGRCAGEALARSEGLTWAPVDLLLEQVDTYLPLAEVVCQWPPTRIMPDTVVDDRYLHEQRTSYRKRKHKPVSQEFEAVPRGGSRGGRGGRGRGRGRGRGGKKFASFATADGAEAAVLSLPHLMRALEVTEAPAATLEGMGTFGSFCCWYAAHNELGVDEEQEEREHELRQEQASKHDERMQADTTDLQQHKLVLSVMPPLHQPAHFMSQVRDSAGVQAPQVTNNYLFAGTVAIFETGNQHFLTCDSSVISLAENAGLRRVPVDEIKDAGEFEAWLAKAPAGSNGAQTLGGAADSEVAEVEAQPPAAETAGAPVAAAPEEAPPPALPIPNALSPTFRSDLVGSGNADTVRPKLLAVMEQPFVWKEQRYAPIASWDPKECRRLWVSAPPSWDQMVLEMKQVYCILKVAESPESLGSMFDSDLADEIMLRTPERTSWTMVKKAAGAYVKRSLKGSGRFDWHALASKVVSRQDS